MSYKLRADQIRTINKEKYRFSVNGGEWHTVDEMLQVSYLFDYQSHHALFGDASMDTDDELSDRSALTMLSLVTLNCTRPVKLISVSHTSSLSVLCVPFHGKFLKSIVVLPLCHSNGGMFSDIIHDVERLTYPMNSHWGTMVGDLSVNLGNGEKLEAAATNEVVETFGVTVAKINEKFEIESVSSIV